MSWFSKVVWSEGLFLRPQHFQQQDRHAEWFVEARTRALGGLFWGFTHLELDEAALGTGKIALVSARGVLPDGTPFEGNRYVDRYVVRRGLIVRMEVWNDSAEWLLVRAGLATG